MYVIVSDKRHFPKSLTDQYHVRYLSLTEFITAVTSEDDMDPGDGLLFDVSVLTEEIYDNLIQYELLGIKIIYYTIGKKNVPAFIKSHVKVFSTKTLTNTKVNKNEAILTYEDSDYTSKVFIDIQTYNKHKLDVQYLDFYEVVKLYAYEVKEVGKWNF